MVRLIFLATLASTTALVQGHFHFVRLAHNGVWQAPSRYIRNVTSPFYEPINPDPYDPRPNRSLTDPTYYTDFPNSVRCGRGNLDHAPDTEVLTVKAGDEIEFVTAGIIGYEEFDDTRYWDCPDGRGFCTYFGADPSTYPMRIVHSGAVSTYLSAVPVGTEIGAYDGSGEWVKIHTTGVEMRKDMEKPYWLPNNNTDKNYATDTLGIPARMPFKIPSQTPAGLYLLRVDLVYNYWNSIAQLYPSCAQIRVESDVTGAALPKGVKFPEVYEPSMPGMTQSYEHGVGLKIDADYVYPGGDLWTGKEMVVDRPDSTPV